MVGMHFHVKITDLGKIASSGSGAHNVILLNTFPNSLANLRDSPVYRDFSIVSARIDAILAKGPTKRTNEIRRNEIISKGDFARTRGMQFQR